MNEWGKKLTTYSFYYIHICTFFILVNRCVLWMIELVIYLFDIVLKMLAIIHTTICILINLNWYKLINVPFLCHLKELALSFTYVFLVAHFCPFVSFCTFQCTLSQTLRWQKLNLQLQLDKPRKHKILINGHKNNFSRLHIINLRLNHKDTAFNETPTYKKQWQKKIMIVCL